MNTELEDLPIEWDEEQEVPEGLPMPKVLLEETAGRRLYKDRMRDEISAQVKAFLKSGGKIKKLKSCESSGLYGPDPTVATEERLQKLVDKKTSIKFCRQTKRWEVRRNSRVVKTLYTLTSAEEYCRDEYERLKK